MDIERLELMHENLMHYKALATDAERLEQTTLYLAELIQMVIDEEKRNGNDK